MAGSKGGTAGALGTQVWLLGNTHPSADRSIPWDKSFGNLNDPDVLVIDLTTMNECILPRIDDGEMDHARESIANKLFHGGTIIIVMKPHFSIRRADSRYTSNYAILPATLVTKTVRTGSTIKAGPNHKFRAYIDNVKKFTFQIVSYRLTARYESPTHYNINLVESAEQTITDNSGNRLGFTLQLTGRNHRGQIDQVPGTGQLVFLPPPPQESADDGIGRILSVYGKTPLHDEVPPAWVENISIQRGDQLQAEIAKLGKQRDQAQARMDALARQRDGILAHRRLLYSKGAELEEAVVQAFKVLGFDDTERMGKADEEDAAFAMGGSTRYSRGVIEAKGAGRGIQLQDILQCNKWTDRRAIADGKPSKGIFVFNQHRLEVYPESSEIRMKIEPNQLEHAELKDICIIPSCVLFEAVSRVLDGEAPDRAKITAMIANSKGVLEDVF